MAIQMQDVVSSNIEAVGYDDNKKILHVRFAHGGTYLYSGVPAQVYKTLLESDSVGTYFSQSIKGVYRFRKEA